jgi:uncharacterized protein (DUF952 family)
MVATDADPFYRVGHRTGRQRAMPVIYKICPRALWREAEEAGRFAGAPIDIADGFIHFSTADQVAETAARHFANVSDLLIIGIEAEALGEALRYEPSRGGALFPHLYGDLPVDAVRSVAELPIGPDGRHVFPADLIAAASPANGASV